MVAAPVIAALVLAAVMVAAATVMYVYTSREGLGSPSRRSVGRKFWRTWNAKPAMVRVDRLPGSLRAPLVASETNVSNRRCNVPGANFGTPTSEERSILRFAADRAAQMMRHLKTRPRRTREDVVHTDKLQRGFNSMVFMTLAQTGGMLKAKCVGLQLRYPATEDRVLEVSAPRMNTRLLHEMAHAIDGSHREGFARANRWLVNIATKELKWRVAFMCAGCRRSGVCKAQCPLCEWWDDPKTCMAYEPSA